MEYNDPQIIGSPVTIKSATPLGLIQKAWKAFSNFTNSEAGDKTFTALFAANAVNAFHQGGKVGLGVALWTLATCLSILSSRKNENNVQPSAKEDVLTGSRLSKGAVSSWSKSKNETGVYSASTISDTKSPDASASPKV